MEKQEYRAKFSEFLGDEERYRKFIAQLNSKRKNRLAFWQEKEIEAFSQMYSIEVHTYEELRAIFNICEVHGTELKDGKVKAFNGSIDYSGVYTDALSQYFPNSWMDEINGPRESWGKYIDIKFCDDCRKSREEWQSKIA